MSIAAGSPAASTPLSGAPAAAVEASGRAPSTAPGSAGSAAPSLAAAGSGAKGSGSAGTASPQGSPATAAPDGRAPILGPAPSRCSPCSPIVLATVGHYSGPISSAAAPYLRGAQAWVVAVNQKGGINGHPVQLLVYDDGADPARTKANVKEAVERKKVIGFLQETAPVTYATVIPYLTEKRIPTVGLSLVNTWNYESPMLFPQGTGGMLIHPIVVHGISQQVKSLGKTKIGVIFCAESTVCSDEPRPAIERTAKDDGMQVVYEAKSSLTQPDYTAECLQARNAGADVLMVYLDPSSVGRVAASCARQSYRPYYSVGAITLSEQYRNNPNIDKFVGATNVTPYFRRGTPAVEEFHAAVARSTSGVSVGTILGWTSGKLLEHAAAHMPEPPTTDALLRGLWSVRQEDLGGLTYPLTFRENQSAEPVMCWWNIALEGGEWASSDDFERHCSPPPKIGPNP